MTADIRVGQGGVDAEARVVDQHVDGTGSVFEAFRYARNGLAITEIRGENFNRAASGFKLRRHSLEAGS